MNKKRKIIITAILIILIVFIQITYKNIRNGNNISNLKQEALLYRPGNFYIQNIPSYSRPQWFLVHWHKD